jgi:thymidylate synthase
MKAAKVVPYVIENSLDDILRAVLASLLNNRSWVKATKGRMTEVTSATLVLSSPRARLSRTEMKGTAFSCLGELLWYLAGSDDLAFIEYYIRMYSKFSDDKKTLHGAYGPRLFGKKGNVNQVENVIRHLKKRPTTRQAVVQLFDANDIAVEHKDVPCTCSLQFMIRRDRLHLFAHMRSNDAFLGLPHDIFAFTMLQELVARSVGVSLGIYTHTVGSLHLYEEHRDKARRYIEEGWQSSTEMPAMPRGSPWERVAKIIRTEQDIRLGRSVDVEDLDLGTYWTDIIRLLQIYKQFGLRNSTEMKRFKDMLSTNTYHPYIDDKIDELARRSSKRND